MNDHIQTIRDALKLEHDQRIAEIQGWADEASRRGDDANRDRYLSEIARLECLPKPWQGELHAA